MKQDQKTMGVVLTWCNEGVKVLTVLLCTPVMLRLLGRREFGLYQIAASAASNLGLLSFGFGSAYIRSHARCRQSREAVARLNALFLLLFSAMGLLCLGCGILLTKNAQVIFGGSLSRQEAAASRKLLMLLVFHMALTFPASVFDGYLAAREAFRFQRLLRLCQSLCSPFLTLPLLMLGFGSPAAAAVTAGLSLAYLIFSICYCLKKLGMPFSFRQLPVHQLRELAGFSAFIFLNQLIDQANWSIDKLLLGRMAGAEAVAVYGIGAQLLTLFIHLSTAVSGVFAPRVHRLTAAGGSNETLTDLMIRVGRIQMLLQGLVLSGFVCFGKSFLGLWAGEEGAESYGVGLLLMAPMTVPLIQNLGLEIQRARNVHRARSLVYAALAAANVLLTTALIPRWGCTGAAAATALTQIAGTWLFMNWYYHTRMGLDMGRFWRSLAPCMLPGAVMLSCVFLKGRSPANWPELLGAIALYTALYGILAWICSLDPGEKGSIICLFTRKGEYHDTRI